MRLTEALLRSAQATTGDWQAHVYLYEQRVLKVPKSLEEIELAITGGADVSEARKKELPAQARSIRDAYFDGIRTVKRLRVPPELLGNPEFLEDGVYWQDRVTPVGDLLRDHASRGEADSATRLLQRYVDFNLSLWSHGVYEVTYNFTCNVGADPAGSLILLDFGELSGDRSWIGTELRTRRWERSWSYKRDMPVGLRSVYAALADRAFTRERFDQVWPTATGDR